MSDQHNDDDPVMFGYLSSRNVTFHGKDETGFTWGEWRDMSQKERDEALSDLVHELVDVYVIDEEESR